MIDQELKQRALTPAAKGEAAPREKILKLGKKITDVVDHKLGKVSAEDAEYWGLAGVVTDEMADIALTLPPARVYSISSPLSPGLKENHLLPFFRHSSIRLSIANCRVFK